MDEDEEPVETPLGIEAKQKEHCRFCVSFFSRYLAKRIRQQGCADV